MISHAFWRSRFGGRPDVVGRERAPQRPPLHRGRRRRRRASTARSSACGATSTCPMMMQAVMRPPRAGYSGEMDPDLLRRRGQPLADRAGPAEAGRHARAGRLVARRRWPRAPAGPRPAGAPPLRLAAVPVDVGDAALRAQLRVGGGAPHVGGRRRPAARLRQRGQPAALARRRRGGARSRCAWRWAPAAGGWCAQLLTESVLLSLPGRPPPACCWPSGSSARSAARRRRRARSPSPSRRRVDARVLGLHARAGRRWPGIGLRPGAGARRLAARPGAGAQGRVVRARRARRAAST